MLWNKVISKWNSLYLSFFIFLLFSPQLLITKNENIRFDHIGVNEGLFQNTVFCIFQDSKGFMWIGLQDGLNRYDGRSFIFYNDSNTKVEDGIFGNVVNAIDEDKNGKIWIGTDKGLIKFDPTLEKFYGIADWQYDKDVRAICVDDKGILWVEADKKVIEVDLQKRICIGQGIEVEHEVHYICRGDDGELWIGTENGLFRVGSEKKISGFYLEGELISKIYKDSAKNENVWVGTETGKLFRYRANKQFELFYENLNRIGLNAICEDNENNLWLGFNVDGIIIYSKEGKTDELKHIEKNFYVPGGLKDNFVQCIFKDNAGTMWIGTHSGGINKYNPNKFKFKSYFNDPSDKNSLSGQSIFSIFEDSQGFIWIGTYDGELDRFDPREEKFESYDKGIFKGKSILSINEDRNGALWIGTSEDLYRLDKGSRIFKPIKDKALGRNIRIIKKDQNNHHFWIGTGEKGIVKFDPIEEKFGDTFSKDNRLSDNNIYSIFPDNNDDNILWIGTAKGLDRVNYIKKEVIQIKNKGIRKDRRIFSIVPDSMDNDVLWLGTDSSGLCKFNKKSKEIISFTIRDGLPNNTVYGIFTDEQGYLWFSTNKGIVQFDPKEEKVKSTFDVNDGLQENEFNHGAYWKNSSGYMYFGGIRGLSVFHPSQIETKIDENTLPQIYFTKLKIGDRKVEIGDDEYFKDKRLQKSIAETKEFELDYKHQPFTLEFAALDYNVPGRIKYKCELLKDGNLIEDNDGKWISNNFYTFSNLNSGRYTFKVWSTNSDITNIDDIIDKYLKHQTPAEIEIIIERHLFDRLKPLIMPFLILLGIFILLIANFYIVFKSRTKRYINKLKMIEEAINDVPQLENIKDVISQMLGYIVYSFGFDYGTISTIDFLNSTIETSMSKTRKPDLIRREDFKCKLNENNILTKVVNGRKTIEDEDVDANLIRVFLPIQDIGKEKDKDNIVLGVVEAGFHKSTRSNISREIRITLELFLNYCSSLFHSSLKRSEQQIVENLLEKSTGIEYHEEYLETILKDTVKLIGSDKGYILFYSLNYKKIDINDNTIFYNFSERDKSIIKKKNKLSTRKRIFRYAAENNHYYFSKDVKKDEYYNEEFEYVNSELAVPMRYYGRIIGVLNIYSPEKDLFDDRKASIIQIIADEAAKSFQNKKINQAIKDMVIPFQLFAGIEKIYELIIQNIKDYFMTELVSIWEKTDIGDFGEYRLVIACDTLKKKYDDFGMHSPKQDIFKNGRRKIQLVNFEQNSTYCGFNEFARKYYLKSMILVPIIIDQQVYGFINIFSKRELTSLFHEEITFLNLVATKGAISVQYEKLISSFIEISDSLSSENLDIILKNITDSARRVLHADPVILFKYDQTQENFEATFSGYLFHPELKKVEKKAKEEDHVVSYVLNKGSVWFEDSNEYKEYINKIGMKHKETHFKDDFWTREKIKSSVGILLKGREREPIGVMFFNYRDVQRFDDNTKRFIETFSSLASSAIVNAKYLDLIEKQNKLLEDQKVQILSKKIMLEIDYARINSINQIVQKISSDEDLENNFKTIVEDVIDIFKADIGYIWLLTKDSKVIKPKYSIGFEDDNFPKLGIDVECITSYVYKTKKPYLWPSGNNDIDSLNVCFNDLKNKVETEIIAPLLYANEVIGFLEVGSYKRDSFDERDKLFLKGVADQIAVIIQNKRFHIATEKLSRIHFDETDIKRNCDILAENADQVLNNSVTCVWLLKTIKGRHCLVMESAHGVNIPDKENYNMFDGEGGISWQTVGNRKEIIIHEDLINPKHGHKHREFIEENELKSMISVPLIVVNEVIGVLNSYSKGNYKFLDKEVHLLKNLATRGAIAIKNAELTKKMEEINEKILDSAQLANPGQVAMSFTHDAKHTMHNINALISSLIYFLPENKLKEENVVNVIKSITRDTDYLRTLLNSMVRYAKRSDVDYKPTRLADIIEYILYICQIRLERNKIACRITYEEAELKELQIECDRSQMEQVFLNLFNNSIYAIKEKMSKGGDIEIFIRSLDETCVEIQFKDNGIGILPQNIDHVFKPSFTTKEDKGSGFGLAICKRIVEDNHGGKIRVESKYYKYTTFFIMLEKSCPPTIK
jgi:ligand-binding sensor domain-containing protein/signal transduction histidine kinase